MSAQIPISRIAVAEEALTALTSQVHSGSSEELRTAMLRAINLLRALKFSFETAEKSVAACAGCDK